MTPIDIIKAVVLTAFFLIGFALMIGCWLAFGTVAFAAVGEIKIAIWLALASSYALFVVIAGGRAR
jgi:hypothetical protein